MAKRKKKSDQPISWATIKLTEAPKDHVTVEMSGTGKSYQLVLAVDKILKTIVFTMERLKIEEADDAAS